MHKYFIPTPHQNNDILHYLNNEKPWADFEAFFHKKSLGKLNQAQCTLKLPATCLGS